MDAGRRRSSCTPGTGCSPTAARCASSRPSLTEGLRAARGRGGRPHRGRRAAAARRAVAARRAGRPAAHRVRLRHGAGGRRASGCRTLLRDLIAALGVPVVVHCCAAAPAGPAAGRHRRRRAGHRRHAAVVAGDTAQPALLDALGEVWDAGTPLLLGLVPAASRRPPADLPGAGPARVRPGRPARLRPRPARRAGRAHPDLRAGRRRPGLGPARAGACRQLARRSSTHGRSLDPPRVDGLTRERGFRARVGDVARESGSVRSTRTLRPAPGACVGARWITLTRERAAAPEASVSGTPSWPRRSPTTSSATTCSIAPAVSDGQFDELWRELLGAGGGAPGAGHAGVADAEGRQPVLHRVRRARPPRAHAQPRQRVHRRRRCAPGPSGWPGRSAPSRCTTCASSRSTGWRSTCCTRTAC